MAEFTEVIRQWKRMRRAHSKCGECLACNVTCGILTVNPEVGEEIENIEKPNSEIEREDTKCASLKNRPT